MPDRAYRIKDDELAALCWCKSVIRHVPKQIIFEGGTLACKKLNCQKQMERWLNNGATK